MNGRPGPDPPEVVGRCTAHTTSGVGRPPGPAIRAWSELIVRGMEAMPRKFPDEFKRDGVLAARRGAS